MIRPVIDTHGPSTDHTTTPRTEHRAQSSKSTTHYGYGYGVSSLL